VKELDWFSFFKDKLMGGIYMEKNDNWYIIKEEDKEELKKMLRASLPKYTISKD
jgi:hypothetical protein